MAISSRTFPRRGDQSHWDIAFLVGLRRKHNHVKRNGVDHFGRRRRRQRRRVAQLGDEVSGRDVDLGFLPNRPQLDFMPNAIGQYVRARVVGPNVKVAVQRAELDHDVVGINDFFGSCTHDPM
jgi:hypothetical protein